MNVALARETRGFPLPRWAEWALCAEWPGKDILETTGNALQATATNESGSLVDLLLNPLTGKVLSATPK